MAEIVIKLLDSKRVVPIGTNGFEIRVENYNGNMIIAGENNVSKITYRFSKEFIDNHIGAPIRSGDTVQITYVNANNEYLIKKYDVDLGDITENGTLDFVDTVSSAVTFAGYTKIYIQWIENEQVENGYIYNWDRFDLKVWSTDPNYIPGTATKYVPATFVEANPTNEPTKDLKTIFINNVIYRIVDLTRDAYKITGGTILTEEVKSEIVKASKVILDETTIYYVEDIDGASGGGLNLFNDKQYFEWDLDSPFSSAEGENYDFVDKTYEENKVYATNSMGKQVLLPYSDTYTTIGLVYRTSNGDILVPTSPSSGNAAVSLRYLYDNYLNKSGGTINGNLAVVGNLDVKGIVTSKEEETLKVKDSIIITNAEGTDITGVLSGLVIRIDKDNVYGIVYDKDSDSVKLGLGEITESGTFIFNENEGNAVSVRADSKDLANNVLLQWNADKLRIESSGKTIDDLPTKNTTPSSLNWTNANGVETSMSFNASVTLTSDNDLNDIKTYGIYQIYTASTPLNTPQNIVQNAILVVLKSNLLPHCCQLFIGTSRYFIRYWTSNNWTSWQELAVGTKVPTIRSLTKNDDLNNLTEYAMYQIYYQSDVANLPKNLPSGLNTNSILNVYQVYSGNTAQVINTSNNALYLRYSYDSGKTWNAWTKMASESYVDDKINSAIITAINANY